MLPILAQAVGGTFIHYAILAVVVAAVIGIVIVAFRYFGITIPQPIVYVFWIVVIAFVCIVGIKLVGNM